eukprot:Selendium_serpulae@DN6495_c1_g1_i9.p1
MRTRHLIAFFVLGGIGKNLVSAQSYDSPGANSDPYYDEPVAAQNPVIYDSPGANSDPYYDEPVAAQNPVIYDSPGANSDPYYDEPVAAQNPVYDANSDPAAPGTGGETHPPIYEFENIYPAMAQGSQGQADTGGSVRRAQAADDTPQTPDAPIPEKTADTTTGDTTAQEPQSQQKSDETPQPPEDPKPETPSEDESDDVLAAGFLKGIKKGIKKGVKKDVIGNVIGDVIEELHPAPPVYGVPAKHPAKHDHSSFLPEHAPYQPTSDPLKNGGKPYKPTKFMTPKPEKKKEPHGKTYHAPGTSPKSTKDAYYPPKYTSNQRPTYSPTKNSGGYHQKGYLHQPTQRPHYGYGASKHVEAFTGGGVPQNPCTHYKPQKGAKFAFKLNPDKLCPIDECNAATYEFLRESCTQHNDGNESGASGYGYRGNYYDIPYCRYEVEYQAVAGFKKGKFIAPTESDLVLVKNGFCYNAFFGVQAGDVLHSPMTSDTGSGPYSSSCTDYPGDSIWWVTSCKCSSLPPQSECRSCGLGFEGPVEIGPVKQPYQAPPGYGHH